jgi:acetyl esterase
MAETSEVDPEILVARALQAQVAPGLDVTKLETAQARALANQAAMVFNDGKPELKRVETRFIESPGGQMRTRFYQPEHAAGRGAIYYIHGGGWFACNIDTHDRMLRFLAAESGLSVFSIDFRLAPEHPFPAALEDSQAGWLWLRANAAALEIDAGRIAVSGDSAGANLALALSLAARDAGAPMPAAGALLYGCFAPGIHTASREIYGTGAYGLTGARLDWYWANYLGAAASAPPVLATPFHADFTGLGPQYIGVAECDTLADENRMIAAKMQAAGVKVTLDVWPHVTHGALQMTRDVEVARQAVRSIARTLVDWL